MNKKHGLTTISISVENYLALKQLGKTGDSFNNVITQLLRNISTQTRSKRIHNQFLVSWHKEAGKEQQHTGGLSV
jgi:predicted CopG family antitoxin